MEYGNPPKVLGHIPLNTGEMMFYLYLPIKMAGEFSIRVPDRLRFTDPVLEAVIADATEALPDFDDHYIYLTAKTLYVEQGSPGNRPGWHADGYGSNGDLSYIWHDMNPTEFAEQEFKDIPDDDFASMSEMERQINPSKIKVYPDCTLLRLDESVVHRVNPIVNRGVRTFIKVSVSRHRYNLAGNSKNYLFDYDWDLFDRSDVRNCDNKDFVKTKETTEASIRRLEYGDPYYMTHLRHCYPKDGIDGDPAWPGTCKYGEDDICPAAAMSDPWAEYLRIEADEKASK
jgi:hypothetical protein